MRKQCAWLSLIVSVVMILILSAPLQAQTCPAGDVVIEYCDIGGQKEYDKAKCTEDDKPIQYECLYGGDVIPRAFGNEITDIRDNIRIAINIALGFIGVIIVLMIVYGGVLWLTAAGSEDKVEKGKHTLIWAALGGIVVSIAWTIASYILQIGRNVGN